MDSQLHVENAARAFYLAEDGGRSWDDAPEALKEEFRSIAREAISLLQQSAPEREDVVAA